MVIERTNNEIIFRLPLDIDISGLSIKKPSEKVKGLKIKLMNWQMNQRVAGGRKIKNVLLNSESCN